MEEKNKMIQQILIGIIFLASVFYIARLFWRNFKPGKQGCAKGCGCEVNESVNKAGIVKKDRVIIDK